MRLGQYFGGYRKDDPDRVAELPRATDHLFRAEAPLPDRVSLLSKIPEVLDQGQLGSCVTHGIGQAVRMASAGPAGHAPPLLSRLWLYYNGRALEDVVHEDAGLQPSDAFQVLSELGFCEEKYWPYDPDRFQEKPPFMAYHAAADQKWLKGYYAVHPGNQALDVKRALAQGYAVPCGIQVDEAFEEHQTSSLGVYLPGGKKLGGHYVCAVGYDGRGLWIVNSWGNTEWGHDAGVLDPTERGRLGRGFAMLPWWYVASVVSDAYAVSFAPAYSEEEKPLPDAPPSRFPPPHKDSAAPPPAEGTPKS